MFVEQALMSQKRGASAPLFFARDISVPALPGILLPPFPCRRSGFSRDFTGLAVFAGKRCYEPGQV